MIGIDTNVLLRYLLKDDPIQSPKAHAIVRGFSTRSPGWVSTTTVLELVWVLSDSKAINRKRVSQAILDLLTIEGLIVDRAEVVAQAALKFRSGRVEFADCLIAVSASATGCSKTLTFDRLAARDAGLELIQ